MGGWVLDPPAWEPVDMVLVVGGREVVWEDGYPCRHCIPTSPGGSHHLVHVKLTSTEGTELARDVALSASLKHKSKALHTLSLGYHINIVNFVVL